MRPVKRWMMAGAAALVIGGLVCAAGVLRQEVDSDPPGSVLPIDTGAPSPAQGEAAPRAVATGLAGASGPDGAELGLKAELGYG